MDKILSFSPSCEKKWTMKKIVVHFTYALRYLGFLVFHSYCSRNRTDMVRILLGNFQFSGLNTWHSFKNFEFCCHFEEKWGNYIFKTWNAIVSTILRVFITFLLPYHLLIFPSTCVDIRAESEKIIAELALFGAQKMMFRSWENQRWTELIQRWLSRGLQIGLLGCSINNCIYSIILLHSFIYYTGQKDWKCSWVKSNKFHVVFEVAFSRLTSHFKDFVNQVHRVWPQNSKFCVPEVLRTRNFKNQKVLPGIRIAWYNCKFCVPEISRTRKCYQGFELRDITALTTSISDG